MICEEIKILGKVQGVFYRAFTFEAAQALNITGWVKNADDGSVVIHACGTAEMLLKFHAKLKVGPPAAKVESLEICVIPDAHYENFVVTK